MDEDPWRNPFAENEAAHQIKPALSSDKTVEPWSSPITEASPSSPFESPAWDIAGSNETGAAPWSSSIRSPTPDWEPAPLEFPTWSTSHESENTNDIEPGTTANAPFSDSGANVHPPWAQESLPARSPPLPTVEFTEPVSTPSTPPANVQSLSPHPSPDAFGSFESATELPDVEEGNASYAWTPVAPRFLNDEIDLAPPWGSAWAGDSASSAHEPEAPKDEWEAATENKRQLDSVIPPQTLNERVNSLEKFLEEVWPAPKDTDSDGNWRESVNGLTSLYDDFLPQLVLPKVPLPNESAVHKATIASLKLTRHMNTTRSSPLSILVASKGSASWERSVKRESKPVPENWGWTEPKHVPETATASMPAPVSDTPVEVKKPGGILSFLGRNRTSSIASVPEVVLPTASSSGSATGTPATSSRPSIESSSSVPVETVLEEPKASIVSLVSQVSRSTESPKPLITALPSNTDGEASVSEPPASSAVSRFFQRFSRNKADDAHRRSISLSEDDISYLGDIVPSSVEDGSDDEFGLGKPIASTSSWRNSTTLTPLPKPLAPPPQPVKHPAVAHIMPSSSHESSSQNHDPDDDPWDVFASAPVPAPIESRYNIPRPSSSASVSSNRSSGSLAMVPPKPLAMGLPRPSALLNGTRKVVTTKIVSPPPQHSLIPALLPPPSRSSTPSTRSSEPAFSPSVEPILFPIPAPSPASTTTMTNTWEDTFNRPTPQIAKNGSTAILSHPNGLVGDESFDSFGDFVDSDPIISTSIPPTPPSKSPFRPTHSTKPSEIPPLPSSPIKSPPQGAPSLPPVAPRAPHTPQPKSTLLNFDFLRSASPGPSQTSNPVVPKLSPPSTSSWTSLGGSASVSPPPLHPPPSRVAHVPMPSIDLLSDFAPPSTLPKALVSNSANTSSKTGLTAQDLTFFEGL